MGMIGFEMVKIVFSELRESTDGMMISLAAPWDCTSQLINGLVSAIGRRASS
jgi:hypothetical protein